jgi:hypothetical protein
MGEKSMERSRKSTVKKGGETGYCGILELRAIHQPFLAPSLATML